MLERDMIWARLLIAQTFAFYLFARLQERGHRAVLRQMEVNTETLGLIVRVAEAQEQAHAPD